MVEKLLESENIDINITNIDGRNALHSIFDDEEEIFNPDNVEPIMKLLIEKGININETDNSGKTALHLASEQNNGNAVGILLRAGADENIKTYDYHPAGQTAYELAENIRNRIELRRRRRLLHTLGVEQVIVEGDEDDNNNLWAYEPLALNAFHQFHREKAQAYLAEEAKNEDSYLNFLPDELEEGISKMLGGSNADGDLAEDVANDAQTREEMNQAQLSRLPSDASSSSLSAWTRCVRSASRYRLACSSFWVATSSALRASRAARSFTATSARSRSNSLGSAAPRTP